MCETNLGSIMIATSMSRPPTPIYLESLTIVSLIHHDSSSWRMDLLQQIFNANDSLAIQSIPLLNVASNVNLIWRFSRNGEYSVRTAQHHLMKSMLQNDDPKAEGKWHLLWQLHVPPKVKAFYLASTKRLLTNKTTVTIQRSLLH